MSLDVIAAIDKLSRLGVINSPEYWKQHYAETDYVSDLIVKSANAITVYGKRAENVETGVKYLVDAGVVTSPLYWKAQVGNVGELVKALGGAVYQSASENMEQKLRQRVCDIINGWIGSVRGDAKHLEILNIYNSHRPLARGYTVKVNDAHCATTTSAAFIKAGISEYTGTECGVEKFVQIAKQKGIWIENDAYCPKIGDAIVYDWDDNGIGDDYGNGDHIGIVTKASSNSFVVTEGNINGGKVGTRNMSVNGRYIRGYIAPDYATISKIMR